MEAIQINDKARSAVEIDEAHLNQVETSDFRPIVVRILQDTDRNTALDYLRELADWIEEDLTDNWRPKTSENLELKVVETVFG